MSEADKTCPAWRKHDSAYRFEGDIVPWERTSGEKRKHQSGGRGDEQGGKPKKPPLPDELKAMRKAFRASVKEFYEKATADEST
jgi:hypothetical protein